MKIFIWILAQISFLYSFSQDSSKLQLFRKGTQLEYQSYFPKYGSFGKQKGYSETTRMVYLVRDVQTDSINHTSTAFIEKKGSAYSSPREFSWKSNLEITTSNEKISFPVGYYLVDTIYFCDINDGGYYKKAQTIFSVTQAEEKWISYPLVASDNSLLDNISYGFNGWVYNPDMAGIDAFSRGKSSPNGQLNKTQYKMSTTTVSRKVAGKVRMRVPAGMFECYKIIVSAEYKFLKGVQKLNSIEYFSPELGLIKTEFLDTPNPGYIELVRVKRGK